MFFQLLEQRIRSLRLWGSCQRVKDEDLIFGERFAHDIAPLLALFEYFRLMLLIFGIDNVLAMKSNNRAATILGPAGVSHVREL